MSGRYAKTPQTGETPAEKDVPAVAYVRMSTDHQKYSTENQLDVIRNYAAARGLTILRVFEDSGRSGLRLDGREALQKLMSEVRSDQADFKAILVYDVSRWGRFQDADEGCPYRKSNPDVVMMEPSEQWDRLDAAHRLRSATDRSILAEREVWPDLIVIQRSSFNMAHARRL